MVRRLFDMQHNRVRLRRLLRPKSIDYGGLRVLTDPAFIEPGMRRALYKGAYERDEFDLVRKYLTKTDRVLEIGTGLGIISSLCASICGSQGVVSYEANPTLEPVIRKNYLINKVDPVLRMRALAAEKGETTFHFHHNFYSSSLVERKNSVAQKVVCDAINDVIYEHQPTAIIMDVEGAEIDLLPLADLSHVELLIVETHPHIVGDQKIDDLRAYLIEAGFLVLEEPNGVFAMARPGRPGRMGR